MSSENLTSLLHSNKSNGWDRNPAPIIAATIESSNARRTRIAGQLRQLLAHRTIVSGRVMFDGDLGLFLGRIDVDASHPLRLLQKLVKRFPEIRASVGLL